MTAILIQLADAVTSVINTEYEGRYVATRSYADWSLDLAAETETLIDVVPVSRRKEIGARSLRDHELKIHVGVRKRFGADAQDPATGRVDTAEVDELVELVEDLETLFDHPDTPLPDMPTAAFVDAKLLGDYDREMLYRNRQFVSVLELTYTVETEVT